MRALALILALAAWTKAADAPVKTVDIHPLLLGPASDPTAPVGAQLERHAAVLAKLDGGLATPESVSQYLLPLMQGSPAERAAAGVLTSVMVRPTSAIPDEGVLAAVMKAAPTAPREGEAPGALDNLYLAAKADSVAARYLDGERAPSAELDGMTMTPSGPVLSGQRLRNLGAGGYGMVDVHPKVEGAVIKTPYELPAVSAEANAATDERTSRALAKAGVGPRVLAVSRELGSPVIVKERVYGDTLDHLITWGLYGRREHALVLAMLDKLAGARIQSDDMREPNIMIGHTLLDPEERAYFIDGGELSAIAPIFPKPAAKLMLLGQSTILDWWDHNGQRHYVTRPFRHVLEQGLVKSGAASPLMKWKVEVMERIYKLRDPKRPTPAEADTEVGPEPKTLPRP